MSEQKAKAKSIIESFMRTLFDHENILQPTRSELREAFEDALSAVQGRYELANASELNNWFELIVADYMQEFDIGSVLKHEGHKPWLLDAQSSIDPYYWTRYKKYLQETGSAWNPSTVTELGRSSDQILDLCGNPKEFSRWSRRGLVLGHVQSGKTANYIGLITKAADAGYDVIVVIAGIQNQLRTQTQIRVEEGFIGHNAAASAVVGAKHRVGVGEMGLDRFPIALTTRKDDYRFGSQRGIPIGRGADPLVFVIKKNSSILDNLNTWLSTYTDLGRPQIDASLLLIDDEADNASINVKYSRDEVSKINGQLRQLLNRFERSSYVGYTATPFANIFIDPDTDNEMFEEDLFPRNFIVDLDVPTHYFGPDKIFGSDGDSKDVFLRPVTDSADLIPIGHKSDLHVRELPDSLKEAIYCFLIVIGIRHVRDGFRSHNSMLINVSRFVAVQHNISLTIAQFMQEIRDSFQLFGSLPNHLADQDVHLRSIHEVWLREYEDTGHDWDEIRERIRTQISSVDVVEVNSKSNQVLNYAEHEQGLNVIAVGGMALSRGLTLEGLSISYYLRRTVMYDTLMQMGRWFGYRPGYEDLCRIFILPEVIEHYRHVTQSVAELRLDLRDMQQAGLTPKDFGLRVRSHPDSLQVTARNKLGASENRRVRIDLSQRFVETHTLKRSAESASFNRGLAKDLAEEIGRLGYSPEVVGQGNYIFEVDNVDPLLRFLGKFDGTPYGDATAELVLPWIEAIESRQGLPWHVLFAGLGEVYKDRRTLSKMRQFNVISQERVYDVLRTNESFIFGSKSRISSRGIERYGLSLDVATSVEKEYLASGKGKNIPDWAYRKRREFPLLVVHHIDFLDGNSTVLEAGPYVGWSISFPKVDTTYEPVSYTLNSRALEELQASFMWDSEEDDQ